MVKSLPIGHNTGIVGYLVLVHFGLGFADELLPLFVGAYGGCALYRLTEVRVDGRPTHRLESLQLPRRRDVKTLKRQDAGFKICLQMVK